MPEELQRVHDKINYETNVVDPKTFAVLLNAVKKNQPLTYKKGRDLVFPQARSAAGMQRDPTKKDTHASGTLEQYGLVIADENRTIKVSDLGYRFLDCFDEAYKIKVAADTYKTILLEMLFTWKETEHGRNIHPGRILFKLLLDKDLGNYTTNHEFAVWTSSEVSLSDRDYDKIKKLILDYRATPYEVAQKKAEVFLRPFANSRALFDSSLSNGTYKFTIKKEIQSLVETFFIFEGKKLKADSNELTRYILKNVQEKNTNAEYASVLKGLIDRCGGEWDAIRIFGIMYHEYVDNKQYSAICSLAGLKESSIIEFSKGKSMGEFVIFKDLLIPVENDQNENTSQGMEELDVRQLILDRYHARTDFDIVALKQKYKKFKSLYSKEVISSLNGIDLLKRLFAPKDVDENSLIYNLEHNSYYGEFGGIGGGSQFKYPLYYYSKKQKWCSGSSLKNQVEYTEDEAIERAEEIRNKLVALFNLVESTDLTHIENFAIVQNLMNSDSLYRKIWVFKYLHMLYPEVFSTFYSWNWLSKVVKFLQLPEGSLLIMNSEISSFAKELRIPNVFLAQIIYELLPSVEEDELDETDEESEEEESEEVMIELPERNPRTYKQFPLNLILYGAPGTGKTYSTMELACSIFDRGTASIDDICEGNTHSNREEVMEHYNDLVKQGFITFTTFHQSYGYEDFIQGLRPDDKSDTLKFVPVDGVFKKIVNKAIKDQTNNYVIIIDEINRANISKVLGELITLLETDKRWGEINQLSTKLPSGQPFAVPNNLYVIGTMNSADKSISLIDAALRRRFEFVEVSVNYKTIANSTARSVLKKINEKLESQLDSSDLLVGHAYFIGKDENSICAVLNHNVIPLLYEYFFDSKAKVKDILKYALDGLNYEIEDEPGKRLRVVKKAK